MAKGFVVSDLFLLTFGQMSKIEPFFPKSHGVARVDDRRVIPGIIYVLKHGLQWKDAPKEYGFPQDALQPLPALVGNGCF